MNEIDSLKKSLEMTMALMNEIEYERISVDPRNKEALAQISTQAYMLQTYMNLLYKRIYTENGPR